MTLLEGGPSTCRILIVAGIVPVSGATAFVWVAKAVALGTVPVVPGIRVGVAPNGGKVCGVKVVAAEGEAPAGLGA